jgi:hypothetical protein
MYYYEPEQPKKKERLLFFVLAAIVAILFGTSSISGMPYPWILQSVSVFFLVGAILLLTQCLSVCYTYAIEQREGALGGTMRELVVTRIVGKRMTVVCRVPVSDIFEIIPINRHNRRDRRALTRGKNHYRYTACLFADNRVLLAIRENDSMAYVQILADKHLVSFLREL